VKRIQSSVEFDEVLVRSRLVANNAVPKFSLAVCTCFVAASKKHAVRGVWRDQEVCRVPIVIMG